MLLRNANFPGVRKIQMAAITVVCALYFKPRNCQLTSFAFKSSQVSKFMRIRLKPSSVHDREARLFIKCFKSIPGYFSRSQSILDFGNDITKVKRDKCSGYYKKVGFAR